MSSPADAPLSDPVAPGTGINNAATFKDNLAELSRLLTALARRTYPGRDTTPERYDFGDIVARTVTTAAANLGGAEALLAGRPGSWEAEAVRQLVHSYVPEDQLHLYRTEPVRLVLDPERVFEDLGLRELFDDADNALSDGYTNGTEPDDDDGANDDAIDEKREALEVRYRADLDRYFLAYAEALRHIVAERGFTVPVELERVTDCHTEPTWDSLAEDLHAAARERTPLPGSSATAP